MIEGQWQGSLARNETAALPEQSERLGENPHAHPLVAAFISNGRVGWAPLAPEWKRFRLRARRFAVRFPSALCALSDPHAWTTAIRRDEFDPGLFECGVIFSPVSGRPPSSPPVASSRFIVGIETPDASPIASCDHLRRGRDRPPYREPRCSCQSFRSCAPMTQV